MRGELRGWYRPTADEFAILWEKGLIFFDASALLALYRITPAARQRLLDIIESLKGQIWVPYQSALEFQRNRLDVVDEQTARYEYLRGRVEKARGTLLANQPRHPVLDRRVFEDRVVNALASIEGYLDECERRHPEMFGDDHEDDRVRVALDASLAGRIGTRLSVDDNWVREARRRYDAATPPGYEDAQKGGLEQFGDLVFWFEVCAKVSTERDALDGSSVPTLLVTEDLKEDWWRRREGQLLGPRPELVEELHEHGGAPFWMYRVDSFMKYAGEQFGWEPEPELVAEVAASAGVSLNSEGLAVERLAAEWLAGDGWIVEVAAPGGFPYDLIGRRGDETIYVETKASLRPLSAERLQQVLMVAQMLPSVVSGEVRFALVVAAPGLTAPALELVRSTGLVEVYVMGTDRRITRLV